MEAALSCRAVALCVTVYVTEVGYMVVRKSKSILAKVWQELTLLYSVTELLGRVTQ